MFSVLRGEVQPQGPLPTEDALPASGRGSISFWHHKLMSEEKVSQQLVLDPLFSHSCWWRIYAQGNDNALAIFCFNSLELRLLCLVTVLALCGQGRRC